MNSVTHGKCPICGAQTAVDDLVLLQFRQREAAGDLFRCEDCRDKALDALAYGDCVEIRSAGAKGKVLFIDGVYITVQVDGYGASDTFRKRDLLFVSKAAAPAPVTDAAQARCVELGRVFGPRDASLKMVERAAALIHVHVLQQRRHCPHPQAEVACRAADLVLSVLMAMEAMGLGREFAMRVAKSLEQSEEAAIRHLENRRPGAQTKKKGD